MSSIAFSRQQAFGLPHSTASPELAPNVGEHVAWCLVEGAARTGALPCYAPPLMPCCPVCRLVCWTNSRLQSSSQRAAPAAHDGHPHNVRAAPNTMGKAQ